MDTSVIPESSAILEASADNGTKVLQPEIVGSPLPLALDVCSSRLFRYPRFRWMCTGLQPSIRIRIDRADRHIQSDESTLVKGDFGCGRL